MGAVLSPFFFNRSMQASSQGKYNGSMVVPIPCLLAVQFEAISLSFLPSLPLFPPSLSLFYANIHHAHPIHTHYTCTYNHVHHTPHTQYTIVSFFVINFFNREKLFCKSPNLAVSLLAPTPFCIISGRVEL